jgi:N-acyl-D-amino-acid deacylase
MARILFQGGEIIDGSGAEAVRADLFVDGDTVAALGPRLATPPGAEIVDCSGLTVVPGFIDIHGHSDTACLLYPRAESRILSGVTTEVLGNCGSSPFPFDGPLAAHNERIINQPKFKVDWQDGPGWFARVAREGCSINLAALVGHGNLRAMTVGLGSEAASEEQLERMAALLDESLAAGAWGFSSGLIYPPGCYSSTEELCRLAEVVGRRGGLYASHIRSESRGLFESVGEFLTIVQAGGCRGVVSHLKTMGVANWHKIDSLIDLLEGARRRGLRVYADRYPYLASWTGLDSTLFEDWLFDGGVDAELGRLGDPAMFGRLEASRRVVHPEADWAARIMIVSCSLARNADLVGLTLADLGRRWNAEPLAAAVRLIIEEETRVSCVNFGLNEENLRRIYRLPYVAVASDASMRNLGDPENAMAHPRAFGTPARFLGEYVREKKLLTWGEGIRRLTGLPAEIMGWSRRGRIAPGAAADLVIIEREKIADRATYPVPAAAPEGFRHVLVAGEFVARDGRHTGARPGRLIRRGEPA